MEKAIEELFQGHYVNEIDCLGVDYKSSTRQAYMEIQLDVQGCCDIYASLDKFCEEEMMDGPNQYKSDVHGLVVSDTDVAQKYSLLLHMYLIWTMSSMKCRMVTSTECWELLTVCLDPEWH